MVTVDTTEGFYCTPLCFNLQAVRKRTIIPETNVAIILQSTIYFEFRFRFMMLFCTNLCQRRKEK